MKYSSFAEMTVVEFEDFIAFANKNLETAEHEELLVFLAARPKAGVIVSGSGGIRKLRWGAKGKGKSGGVRVIYYYHDHDMPLLLLTGFAKSDMENIGQAARNAYKKLVPLLVQHYRARGKK